MNLPIFYSSEDIRANYIQTSQGHFFDKDTMRFFKSRLTSNFKKINENMYLFITSEKKCFNDETRVYTVRKVELIHDETKFCGYKMSISTIDHLHAITRSKALTAIKNFKIENN